MILPEFVHPRKFLYLRINITNATSDDYIKEENYQYSIENTNDLITKMLLFLERKLAFLARRVLVLSLDLHAAVRKICHI